LRKQRWNLVERHETIAVALQAIENEIEEYRRDFQVRVRRESGFLAWTDMMERADGPKSARAAHHACCAQEVGRLKTACNRNLLCKPFDTRRHLNCSLVSGAAKLASLRLSVAE
jgi:hypothetical protein